MDDGMRTQLSAGARVTYDGQAWEVAELAPPSVLLAGPAGRLRRVSISHLLAAPGTRIGDSGAERAADAGLRLACLGGAELAQLRERVAHVREACTGYRRGSPELALPGEPRPEYAPGAGRLQRYQAKAAEMRVGVRTVERWAARLERDGPAGLVDERRLRRRGPQGGADARWLAMARTVLAEHGDASTPTQDLVLARTAARLDAEHGTGAVPLPGKTRARALLREITKGTSAFGGAKARREIAGRPAAPYGRLEATRPGEYVLLDTTRLDVFAMDPVTLRWVQAELTIAMDVYDRCITGLRLTPVSTKAVDAAAVLFESVRPLPEPAAGWADARPPYHGLPGQVIIDAARLATEDGEPLLPSVAAETVVVDRGKIYLSEHLMSACARLGISVQPARVYQATDKAALERFFRTLREQLLAALPGYKGPDVYRRGKNPEQQAFYFLHELEQIVRRWTAGCYHRQRHSGLCLPEVPGLQLSPLEMFAHGAARAGFLQVPARADLVFDFLKVEWRTIQHYGVEIGGLRYDGPALNGHRNQTSPYGGKHAGLWPLRVDPGDVSRVWFQDPDDDSWHPLKWEHADALGAPFSSEALDYARQLAAATHRFPDTRRALAELLEQWGSGLAGDRAGRRMALRLSEQRLRLVPAPPAEAPGVPEPSSRHEGGDGDSGGTPPLRPAERAYSLSTRPGWEQFVTAPPRQRPDLLTAAQIRKLPVQARAEYEEQRSVWHANLGPLRTPQMRAVHEDLDDIVEANRQDGDKVKGAAVIDAFPGLGKSTIAQVFAREFHQRQVSLYGPLTSAGHDRIPVAHVCLTSSTSKRSFNAMLCRFFGLPGHDRGNAEELGHKAADAVLACDVRLCVVDDVHFLDPRRRDGRDVANHFKYLANTFPVTFLFVGVGLERRGLVREGLAAGEEELAQNARRWTTLGVSPFEITNEAGRRTWRQLLLAIEKDLVLADAHPGMVADDLADYLFARSTGHFASLMTLITRGCRRAVRTGTEKLTRDLLDQVRNDAAAEAARQELLAAFDTGRLSARPAAAGARALAAG